MQQFEYLIREALMSKKKSHMLRQICLLSVCHLAFFTKNESVKMQNSFGQTFSNDLSQELYLLEKKLKLGTCYVKKEGYCLILFTQLIYVTYCKFDTQLLFLEQFDYFYLKTTSKNHKLA